MPIVTETRTRVDIYIHSKKLCTHSILILSFYTVSKLNFLKVAKAFFWAKIFIVFTLEKTFFLAHYWLNLKIIYPLSVRLCCHTCSHSHMLPWPPSFLPQHKLLDSFLSFNAKKFRVSFLAVCSNFRFSWNNSLFSFYDQKNQSNVWGN